MNVLLQASLLGLPAIGMTVVMIVCGIDLSLPANVAMSAVAGALYMKSSGKWTLGTLIIIGTGAAIGIVNGIAVAVAVARLRMIPFVVTLATMTVVSRTSVWIANSLSIAHPGPGQANVIKA
jgi:ribose transport system permease protein